MELLIRKQEGINTVFPRQGGGLLITQNKVSRVAMVRGWQYSKPDHFEVAHFVLCRLEPSCAAVQKTLHTPLARPGKERPRPC